MAVHVPHQETKVSMLIKLVLLGGLTHKIMFINKRTKNKSKKVVQLAVGTRLKNKSQQEHQIT